MRVLHRVILAIMSVSLVALVGCQSAQQHLANIKGADENRLTVGTVQKEIRVGMSGAGVIQALGSPNIVSTDEQGREVWVYDKISTTRVYSQSRGGISTLILGGAVVGSALVGAGVSPYYGSGAGASETRQRTLTILIKFDNSKKVRDFAYHSSRF